MLFKHSQGKAYIMKTTDRKTVRKAFKDIGYKVGFVRNECNHGLVSLGFHGTDDLLSPKTIANSNVFPAEFYAKHKQAFELLTSFDQHYLTDTDQKII